MEDLPHDLIKEVLSWLPVKSLLRFRCFSKSWHETIDSRDFIYSHLDKSSNNRRNHKLIWQTSNNSRNCKLICYYYARICALDINNGFQEEFHCNFGKRPYRTLLSHTFYCNGLILLNPYYVKVSVWNPSTRKERDIPECFPKRISYEPYDTIYRFLCCGRPRFIVAFDVSKETFSVVPVPIYQGDESPRCLGSRPYLSRRCLQAFEGCLSIKIPKIRTMQKVDLYVRKKEGIEFTWTKLFSLTTVQFGPMFALECITLGHSKEGDKILLSWCGNLYSYDSTKEIFNK